jgi:SAM-dependent methyltransferase
MLMPKGNKSLKGTYVRKGNRLSLFKSKADPTIWEELWISKGGESALRQYLRPSRCLGSLGRFFHHWLPREGPILEAGCGRGLWVRRLEDWGFHCLGLDYAVATLQRSKALVPELPLLGGDVLQLPLADNSLAAYVSLGVLEHFEEGPQPALREAQRVLKHGGVACITVPYENYFRRQVSGAEEEEAKRQGLKFYQYYFRPEDLEGELLSVGLKPQGVYEAYAVRYGLKEQGKIWNFFMCKVPFQGLWTTMLDFLPLLPLRGGHMIFTVARKV